MRKLTIEGRPIAIWMETQGDVDRALKEYEDLEIKNYVPAKGIGQVMTALGCGLVPVFHCPFEDVEKELFPYKHPVLFCIATWDHRTLGGDNPLKEKLYRLRLRNTGLVAFGESPCLYSGERSVWGIPHHHVMNFKEFGYS
jgi:hypothetical protein